MRCVLCIECEVCWAMLRKSSSKLWTPKTIKKSIMNRSTKWPTWWANAADWKYVFELTPFHSRCNSSLLDELWCFTGHAESIGYHTWFDAFTSSATGPFKINGSVREGEPQSGGTYRSVVGRRVQITVHSADVFIFRQRFRTKRSHGSDFRGKCGFF